jgi:hypothetical protein
MPLRKNSVPASVVLAVLVAIVLAVVGSAALSRRTDAGPGLGPAHAPARMPPSADRLPPPPYALRRPAADPPRPTVPVASAPGSTVVVTYLHTKNRCPSCIRLEKLAEQTVKTRFSRQIASGLLTWRSVDVDEPHRAHLVHDYQLHTKSIVVSEVRGGFEVRWKELDRAWALLEDTEALQRYVEQEVRGFLRPG